MNSYAYEVCDFNQNRLIPPLLRWIRREICCQMISSFPLVWRVTQQMGITCRCPQAEGKSSISTLMASCGSQMLIPTKAISETHSPPCPYSPACWLTCTNTGQTCIQKVLFEYCSKNTFCCHAVRTNHNVYYHLEVCRVL